MARRQRALAMLMAAEALLRPALIVLFVVLLQPSVTVVLMAMAVQTALVMGLALLVPRREGLAPTEDDPIARRHLGQQIRHYARPLVPLALATWAISVADRYLIGINLDDAAVGIYVAAYALGSQPFVILQGAISRTLVRSITARWQMTIP